MSLQIKTVTELVAEALAWIGASTKLTNFNAGSVVRTWTEVFCGVVGDLYTFAGEMLAQGFIDTATGFWLDRKAREYGIVRNAAITTKGVVLFSRLLPKSTNITIPAGTLVKSNKDQSGVERRYTTDAEVILLAGTTEIEADVTAEDSGSDYNLGAGSIVVMAIYISGLDSVTNEADWITQTGVDKESDTLLRNRLLLAWEELSQGGTAAAYVSWALSVPGVKSAFVDDNLPRGDGTLDVYIMDEAGSPAPALIAAVQLVVDANRPITADALVLGPDIIEIDLTLTVTPRVGWDIVAMEAEIRRRFSVYFGDVEDETLSITPIGVGKDIVLAQLVAVVMGVSGVYSVTFSDPVADLEIDPNEFPESRTITITMAAASTE